MSELRKSWLVQEVLLANGDIGQRQTVGVFNDNGDSWGWVRPDDRLDDVQKAEWDRVLSLLKNVGGEDLRHVVCFGGLLDHCVMGPSNYV